MEITEKLNIFYSSAIEAANALSKDEMRKFSSSSEKIFKDYENSKKREIDSRYLIEAGKMKRDANRKVSEALTEQKRMFSRYQQEKKDALFEQVEDRLCIYRKTEDYDNFLISKIKNAKEFARQEEIEIYLDPEDAEKKGYLEKKTGCKLNISEHSFKGGIQAVIRSKNILIDESFETKLNQEREAYAF